jgi:hypothetical protein
MALTKIPAHLSSTPSISDSGSSTAITIDSSGNVSLAGNLSVTGSTTTADNLVSADKNITLNYHASNDTSGSADGAGITIQDAVDASNNASLTWNASGDKFVFSHLLNAPRFIQTSSAESSFYSGTFSRSGSGTSADVYGGNGTLALGYDASNTRLVIANNPYFTGGNVGIGTSSPIAPLHVLGNAVIETGSPDLYLATTSATHTNWRIAAQEVVNQGFEIASGTTSAGSNAVADTYTTRLTIKNDGKVGIGTTSPGTKVHVYGTDSSIQLECTGGTDNAWTYYKNPNKTYLVGLRGSSSHAFTVYDLTDDHSRFRVNSDGGVAIGEDNVGYAGQILSIKSGTGNNVLYGESSDANCIMSVRDNGSSTNVGFGCISNAHVFFQDGTEIARLSTGSGDKYSYSSAGLGGSGTNLHLHSDDSEIRMANNIIHSDNSGFTKFTIRTGYGVTSDSAELSLDGGYISFNTGSSFTERMRVTGAGKVYIGTSGPALAGVLSVEAGNAGVPIIWAKNTNADSVGIRSQVNSTSAGNYIFAAYNSGGIKWKIRNDGDHQGTDTSIGSISDSRTKKDVADLTYDIAKFKQYRPITFNWINPDCHNHKDNNRGFLAQEVKAIDDFYCDKYEASGDDIPLVDNDGMAHGTKFGYKDAMYISVIQQLITRLEAAEAKITALEG